MRLEVIKFGHPVLRQKGARVTDITPAVRRLIEDMLETMYDAKGVGLAAQQVGHAVQLTVIDVRGVSDRPSTLEIGGKSVKPDDHMPMVLLNPEVKPLGQPVAGPEGCLSFPEVYADIVRPESVEVKAQNELGDTVTFKCGGLLSRAVQHETDHLNGILFIDRMDRKTKEELRPELEYIQQETKAVLKKR